MRIFFQRGAAAGGIGDDGVEIVGVKCGEICEREIAGHIADSGMCCKRATANLFGGDYHFAAVCLQHADGCAIEFAESNLSHASGEESYSSALVSLGWEGLA